jgi:DNA invertase Pin-like site-specific DNA recombinase
MLDAYCYLRVSSNNQLDGFGFDRQFDTIKAYARKNGYKIVEVFREQAVSGTTDETERPQFQRMMAEILTNGVNTVLVEGLDRLAREYRIQETLVVYLASKGVNLISARTGENVTEAIEGDPLRKALVQIQGIFNELDKSQLVLRLKKGKEKAKREGRRTDGQKRYGEESAEEREAITRIRLWRRPRRKGGPPGLTYRAIADRLNKEGPKPKKAESWTPHLVAHFAKKS